MSQAMAQAKSTDPVKVANAMEGMKVKSAFGGEVEMRKSDHQLQQPLYMTVWQKADAKYPVQPREHRHDAGAGGRVPELRVEHAHQLPDEAPRRLTTPVTQRGSSRSHRPSLLPFGASLASI